MGDTASITRARPHLACRVLCATLGERLVSPSLRRLTRRAASGSTAGRGEGGNSRTARAGGRTGRGAWGCRRAGPGRSESRPEPRACGSRRCAGRGRRRGGGAGGGAAAELGLGGLNLGQSLGREEVGDAQVVAVGVAGGEVSLHGGGGQ